MRGGKGRGVATYGAGEKLQIRMVLNFHVQPVPYVRRTQLPTLNWYPALTIVNGQNEYFVLWYPLPVQWVAQGDGAALRVNAEVAHGVDAAEGVQSNLLQRESTTHTRYTRGSVTNSRPHVFVVLVDISSNRQRERLVPQCVWANFVFLWMSIKHALGSSFRFNRLKLVSSRDERFRSRFIKVVLLDVFACYASFGCDDMSEQYEIVAC